MQYTFALSRRSLPVRCLCLLLIVLVLWCSFMMPHASAVALEAATVAYGGLLIGTILVGAGVIFSSHGDMVKVGNAMAKSFIDGSNAIWSKISAISSWAVEHGEAAAKGALRVGKEMYQEIVDAFNASYSDNRYYFDADVSRIDRYNASSFVNAFNALRRKSCSITFDGHIYGLVALKNKDGSYAIYESVDGSDSEVVCLARSGNFSSSDIVDDFWIYLDNNGSSLGIFIGVCLNGQSTVSGNYHTLGSFPAIVSPSVPLPDDVVLPTPDIAYPSDDYLVKMPDIPSVDTGTGEVTYPDSIAYTKDAVAVPYPTDADGVKVPDIPYDKVVDQSTGKTLDDTGTDTDKPGTDAETGGLLGQIVALLKNFFDSPSDFKLDMDGFRNLAIKDKFPFCIPFDMVDSVKQFAATAADYEFRIDLQTQFFSVDHVVDLTPLAVPLAFFRYIVVSWFVWVLLSRTRDLMKW